MGKAWPAWGGLIYLIPKQSLEHFMKKNGFQRDFHDWGAEWVDQERNGD